MNRFLMLNVVTAVAVGASVAAVQARGESDTPNSVSAPISGAIDTLANATGSLT